MIKHSIWSNDVSEIDAIARGLMQEEPELSEREAWDLAEDYNSEYLLDERYNLNILLPTDIIIIADLGLWNGRVKAYKELNSCNIKSCLYASSDGEYMSWYVDGNAGRGDLRCDETHHDGTNHYLYRRWKEGISEAAKESFLEKIYNSTATPKDVSRYTKSLAPEIAKAYGW